jgi:peroxiredoxin
MHRVSETRVLCGFALGALLASAAFPAPATLLGKPAPDFVLKSLDGSNLRLSEYRGQVVMVVFWARWEGEARQEMPVLDHINTTYNRSGLVVLGVSVDEDARRARDFAQGMKLGYPVLLDTTPDIGRDYSIQRMPLTILVDRSGVVRFSSVGYKPGDDRTYLDKIRELLRE